MWYNLDRWPEGPERSSLSLAMDSEMLEDPADCNVGCLRKGSTGVSLPLEALKLSLSSMHWPFAATLPASSL